MIRIGKRLTFAASHILWNDDWIDSANHEIFGKCSSMHGHNYVVEIDVAGTPNSADGMVVNYDVLKDLIKRVDHKHLNDVVDVHPVTAENLCTWFVHELDQIFVSQHRDARTVRVLVKETESSFAEWTK